MFTTPAFWVGVRPIRPVRTDACVRRAAVARVDRRHGADHWSLWVATVMIGVSFSLVPAVMWPLTSSLFLPYGSARRLASFGSAERRYCRANLVAGSLND